MNREAARQEIKERWREILETETGPAKQKVNGETSYICPLCGHGTNGDGITRNTGSNSPATQLKCFGCDFSGDIIDLYARANNLDFNQALTTLADLLYIDIDPYTPATGKTSPQEDFAPANDNLPATAEKSPQNEPQAAAADYTAYYEQCTARLKEPAAASYLNGRGISIETAAAYKIGYDPAADPANAPGAADNEPKLHPAPRIIIPTTRSHYVARAILPDTPAQYNKLNPARNKGAGSAGIFNKAALYAQEVQAVFIVEGAFDALSLLEVGAPAMALNSTSNADLLLKDFEKHRTASTLVLCMDNDDSGRKAADKLKDGLRRLNISFITADIAAGYKDANEALVNNRNAFIEAVEIAQHRTAAKPDNAAYYIDNLMAGDLRRFNQEIKTGFDNLDQRTGGLYSGLYVIAAISSLGKTTFAHQMADNIAAAGNDVLFFSMEQSRLEMVSKSIARETFTRDPGAAVGSLAIRKGYLPPQVIDAAEAYKNKVGDRLSIIEGGFNCTVSFIGDYVRQYIRRNNTRPVVVIDYLQIIQPEAGEARKTTKETVDAVITDLKRLSNEGLPVIVISSVNRGNYLTPIDFESIKESGGVEYTADVVYGLQLQCLNEALFEAGKDSKIKEKRQRVKAAKAANPRKIELVCLKNRYGLASFSEYFNYYPANDYFEVCSEAEIEFAPGQRRL